MKDLLERSISETDSSVDQLVMNYYGRVHFQEAINSVTCINDPEARHGIVEVAEHMAEAGIPPVFALEHLK